MSELIRFECPQCRKILSAKPAHAGRSTKCPGCQCLLKVPSPASASDKGGTSVDHDPTDEMPLSASITPSVTMADNRVAKSIPDTPPTSGPTPDLTGTKSCPFCAETVLAAAKKCKHCGEFLDPVLIRSQSQGAVSATTPAQPEGAIIRRIHDWEHLSSILWIVLGAIQIVAGLALAGVPTMVGVYNVVGGIQSRKLLRRILNRDTTIPDEYQPVVWMVIVGIVNLCLGGVIGIGLTIFDFVIRDKVLSNRQLFNVAVATATLPPDE